MTAPPASERKCCFSYVGHPHQADCTRKGGRTPTAAGTAPNRNIRVHDDVWDPCEAQAKTDGQTMAAFVRDAITRELDRRRTLAAPGTVVWAGPPDHPARGNLPLYEGKPLAAAPQCSTCTSPYRHHRFALPVQAGPQVEFCQDVWHTADSVTSGTYTTPGARHCRCEYLGVGTPEHDVSALCLGLRPDADRDPPGVHVDFGIRNGLARTDADRDPEQASVTVDGPIVRGVDWPAMDDAVAGYEALPLTTSPCLDDAADAEHLAALTDAGFPIPEQSP